MEEDPSRTDSKVVTVALLSNLAVSCCKFLVAYLTGSSALLAEGFHSLADSSNQLALLCGAKLSKRPPDKEHPFGHGKDRYVWAFVASILIFVIGALFSVLEGLEKLQTPVGLFRTELAYLVIGVSAFFEAFSFKTAFSALKPFIKGRGVIRALKESKSPGVFVTFLEDSAALFGLGLAFIGVLLTDLTGSPAFDGLASISIGGLLGVIALFISYETRSLIIGEGLSQEELAQLKRAILKVPEVKEVLEILTMHLGPDEVLVNVSVNFVDGLDTDRLEEAIDKVKKAIEETLPSVKKVFVEAESLPKEALPPRLKGYRP